MIWWAPPQENTLAAGSRDQTIHIFDTSSSSKAALRQLKGRGDLWAERSANCGGSSTGEGRCVHWDLLIFVVFELTLKDCELKHPGRIPSDSTRIWTPFVRTYLYIQTHDIYISTCILHLIFWTYFSMFWLSFGSMSFLNDISIDFVSKASEATLAQWLTCSAVQMVAFWWQTPRMARLGENQCTMWECRKPNTTRTYKH